MRWQETDHLQLMLQKISSRQAHIPVRKMNLLIVFCIRGSERRVNQCAKLLAMYWKIRLEISRIQESSVYRLRFNRGAWENVRTHRWDEKIRWDREWERMREAWERTGARRGNGRTGGRRERSQRVWGRIKRRRGSRVAVNFPLSCDVTTDRRRA